MVSIHVFRDDPLNLSYVVLDNDEEPCIHCQSGQKSNNTTLAGDNLAANIEINVHGFLRSKSECYQK